MLNRSNPPPLKPVDRIEFISPKKYHINDHVNLYHMKEVANETARFDLYFDAGKSAASNGIPEFVNGLLLSGTKNKTSIQINDAINGLGGFYNAGIALENSVISMFCLRENISTLFNTVLDAVCNVSFIKNEVEEFLADRKQQHKINLEKVGYLAHCGFQKELFSNNQAYASTLKASDFENVSSEQLIDFHVKHYLQGLLKVVVVGNIDTATIQEIVAGCQGIAKVETVIFPKSLINLATRQSKTKKDSVQTAIRVGRILFNKKNEQDYMDFLILNTILGDYFGSRLMKNIREDKGYTYGINSNLVELQETGYFIIATEVGKEFVEETLNEIKKEIEKLQQNTISNEELNLVRNYMLGQLLKNADGPYAMMDMFISAEMHGKGLVIYNKAIVAIQNITPERIRDLAHKYLNWNDMCIFTAG